MQNQTLPTTTKNHSQPHRLSKNVIFFIITLCTSITIGLYLFQTVPRYIILSIPPPEDSYDLVDWNSTTKSVITTQSSRDFVWRQDATLAYENSANIPLWNTLVEHFERRFLQLGWKQSDTSLPCSLYLPEAAFLNYGEKGFTSYRRTTDTDEIPTGDAICLAIWNDNSDPNVFRIVLLTVRRSFLTSFYKIFD